jgi:hypothetical protein
LAVRAIDHVQLRRPEAAIFCGARFPRARARPPGGENQARALTACGGCWFDDGASKVHLGVDASFQAARNNILIAGFAWVSLLQRLMDEGASS